MTARDRLSAALEGQPRVRLATLPTALERGPDRGDGGRLYVKRDDLTGLGLGGNKARKLEFLCAAALAHGADTLVTVGAAQSNHARMTAAAGAVLGLETHLILGGDAVPAPAGNPLLAQLFGAHLHHVGTDDWTQLTHALERVAAQLREAGRRPYVIPLGGSTAIGALGFALAWIELLDQCAAEGRTPAAIVHASSTGGTDAGLLVGRAVWAACRESAPAVIAIDVAKESEDLAAQATELADAALALIGLGDVRVTPDLVTVDGNWTGEAYALPSAQRCEGEVELAGGDGGQVRVDLGVIGQPGGDQLGADVSYRRDLQAITHRPADRETSRRRDVDQARRTQRPRQRTAVTQVSAPVCHQLPEGPPQPVGALLRRAGFLKAHQWLQLGVGVFHQQPAAGPQRRHHRCQRSGPVGQVDEDESGVHQVEGARFGRRIGGEVVPAYLIGSVRVQPCRIDVGRQYVPGRTDGRGERLGDAAAAGPRLPTAPARPRSQAVEVRARHAVEQLGQCEESLARLGSRIVEKVAVVRGRCHDA